MYLYIPLYTHAFLYLVHPCMHKSAYGCTFYVHKHAHIYTCTHTKTNMDIYIYIYTYGIYISIVSIVKRVTQIRFIHI